MVNLIVRVVMIDEFGFTGREHHPEPDMIGQQVRVSKMTTFCESGDEELDFADSDQNHGDAPFTVLYGQTDDLRPVELLDHEVVIVSIGVNDCL